MEDLIYINGDYVSEKEANVSVFDSGFTYGDGLFETLRVYGGIPFLFKEHIERMQEGAGLLSIKNVPDYQSFKEIAAGLLKEKKDGMLKIIITRGKTERATLKQLLEPTVVVFFKEYEPLSDLYETGVKLTLAEEKRSALAHIKSLNYLPNLLSRQKAKEKGFYDVLFFNKNNMVKEGSMSNIFFVSKETISTPALDGYVLPGITRSFLLEILDREGFLVKQEEISKDRLNAYDEAFVTNSLIEILPVSVIDRIEFKQNTTTKSVQDIFRKYQKAKMIPLK